MTYPTAKLGDVAEFIRGITFKPDDVVPVDAHDAVVCMRTKNVQTLLDCDDLLAVPSQFVRRKDQYLYEGDILVSSANSWNLVGKCCWVPALPWRAAFGGFISVLRGDANRVDRRYLYWWFASERIQALLRSFGQKTTNISNLNIERCLQLELPLPSVKEQRRIAAILDKADALRSKRREALSQLDRLAQATFVEMFGDPLTNSKGWPEGISLGEVADVVSGVTKGRKLDGKTTREVPYLAVANVQDMRLNLSAVKRIEATEEEIGRYALRDGDLLLTEGGDPDKLGRGTLWHGELPECIHQNHVFRVRVTADSMTPYFLNWLVGSQRGKRYFLKSAKQTTGIASINMTQLRGFPLLLPPVSLQREFEETIGALQRHTARLRAAEGSCNALFAALRHRAFWGAL